MNKEIIEIIIPAYNCADTIGDTIQSLDQGFLRNRRDRRSR